MSWLNFDIFQTQENEAGPSNSHIDKLPPRGQGGKGASRQAKQRAIARGDNLAPAQVTDLSCVCMQYRLLDRPVSKVIKLFSCSTELSMKLQLLIKHK